MGHTRQPGAARRPIKLAGSGGTCQAAGMSWQHVRISRFGGPEVLELAEETILPDPGAGEVRIRVLAAGTGFTDSFIRRGRYPDFKGPLPFTPGYDLVGVVDKAGALVGIITDGDLRRHMERGILDRKAREIMTARPKTVPPDMLVAEALTFMNLSNPKVTHVFVVEGDQSPRPVGFLSVHDCLRAGFR